MTITGWRATAAIAVATLLVSGLLIVNGLIGPAALGWGFIPALASGDAVLPPDLTGVLGSAPVWLTPLTATLVHGGWAHLGLNLVMLVYCGQQAERPLGARAIVLLYVVGAYAAAAGQWVQAPDVAAPMIGASGAISAVVAAYALLYGRRRRGVGEFAHVVWLGVAWTGIQLLLGLSGMAGGQPIAIGAHIGGFIAGLALTRPLLLWKYRRA